METERATLIVLRKTAQGYTLRDFRRLVRASDWSAVHYLSVLDEHEQRQSLSRWGWYAKVYRLRRRLDRLAAHLGEAERLFLGNYLEPLARHFANRLPHCQTVLLDDGTATLHVRRLREVKSTLPRTRAALINRCLGFDERQDARVTYFTTYALSEYGDDEVIQHRYAHLGSLAVTRGGERERLFLGQSLIEDGIMTKADYFRAFGENQAASIWTEAARPSSTFPHSREDPAHVREIAQTFGFPIRRFDYPFEHQFTVESTPLPAELSSFFCSALENARLLFRVSARTSRRFGSSQPFSSVTIFSSRTFTTILKRTKARRSGSSRFV